MIAPSFAKATVGKRLHSFTLGVMLIAAGASPFTAAAYAQAKPKPAPAAAPQSRSVTINGYAMIGRFNLLASESFEAITGTSSGGIFGGGVRVGLPWGNISWGGPFIDIGAWRYQTEGQRVFVSNGTIYPLNIPVEIALTPLELSAGWQFRFRRLPKLTPYVAAGLTAMQYQETSSFADASENVEDNFAGYHVIGGAEFRIIRWVGIAGEAGWSTVPEALGTSGVSEAFNETNLGGATFRFKITVGR
jgi:opacity protein-like surface antigen